MMKIKSIKGKVKKYIKEYGKMIFDSEKIYFKSKKEMEKYLKSF